MVSGEHRLGVWSLRSIKTGGFNRVRGNVELGFVIKERLRDRY